MSGPPSPSPGADRSPGSLSLSWEVLCPAGSLAGMWMLGFSPRPLHSPPRFLNPNILNGLSLGRAPCLAVGHQGHLHGQGVRSLLHVYCPARDPGRGRALGNAHGVWPTRAISWPAGVWMVLGTSASVASCRIIAQGSPRPPVPPVGRGCSPPWSALPAALLCGPAWAWSQQGAAPLTLSWRWACVVGCNKCLFLFKSVSTW